MRHTAATRWLRAGGSEGGLMSIAGWSTRSMHRPITLASAAERAAGRGLRRLGLGSCERLEKTGSDESRLPGSAQPSRHLTVEAVIFQKFFANQGPCSDTDGGREQLRCCSGAPKATLLETCGPRQDHHGQLASLTRRVRVWRLQQDWPATQHRSKRPESALSAPDSFNDGRVSPCTPQEAVQIQRHVHKGARLLEFFTFGAVRAPYPPGDTPNIRLHPLTGA